MGSGAAAAHAGGVVHRDIKPENIFLCSDGSGELERVKVLDFGISKMRAARSAMTTDHALLGTTCYMSPEQAEGQTDRVDHRTDIFALGTICYEALTGLLPFNAASVPSVLYRICHVQPRPAVTLNPELPPAVDGVLARAMAKRREDRYPEVGQLVADLQRCLRPESAGASDAALVASQAAAAATPVLSRGNSSRWWMVGAAVMVALLAGGGIHLATRSSGGLEGRAAPEAGPHGEAVVVDAGPPRADVAAAADVAVAADAKPRPKPWPTPASRPRPRVKSGPRPKPKKEKNGEFLFDRL